MHTHVAGLAAAQHGVVATAQLHELGYTDAQIHRRVRAGRLHRLHRGVYAVGHTNLTQRGRWMAAVLAAGPGALLSHGSAAALWEMAPARGGPIEVTTCGQRRFPRLRCHRAGTLRAVDSCMTAGIPVTSPARTLLDLAATLTPQRLRTALDQAQRRDLLDARDVDDLLAHAGGHRGVHRLRMALAELEDEPPWTQSELERWFLELAREQRLPAPLTNVPVEGELVDALFPGHRLIVEVDGWEVHRTRRAFEQDRRRDARLAVAGYLVVRVTYRRLRDQPREVARELSALLRAAKGGGR